MECQGNFVNDESWLTGRAVGVWVQYYRTGTLKQKDIWSSKGYHKESFCWDKDGREIKCFDEIRIGK